MSISLFLALALAPTETSVPSTSSTDQICRRLDARSGKKLDGKIVCGTKREWDKAYKTWLRREERAAFPISGRQ